MRAEDVIIALRKRQEALQVSVFMKPPQDFNEFTKLLGVWTGLNEALGVVEDVRKKDRDDD